MEQFVSFQFVKCIAMNALFQKHVRHVFVLSMIEFIE